jgi:hypothetical protein
MERQTSYVCATCRELIKSSFLLVKGSRPLHALEQSPRKWRHTTRIPCMTEYIVNCCMLEVKKMLQLASIIHDTGVTAKLRSFFG